nr:MAG TPA: hypothetical protein [Caudoviricetes sp.]
MPVTEGTKGRTAGRKDRRIRGNGCDLSRRINFYIFFFLNKNNFAFCKVICYLCRKE